ncbi:MULTISPECIES: hypothetical protein [Methylobacterium]|uniref:hypothetical protein n=1 Tax=Methylobacterium TaxID=407 RepID=UPI0013EA15BE|nr:hypothetical protein [Methylobacterium sp. DB0501]NGM33081.1 hypothetical protein [Methylobacterium sp. DB0501]
MAETHPPGFRVEPQIEETLEKPVKEDHRSVSSLVEKILPECPRADGLLQSEAFA